MQLTHSEIKTEVVKSADGTAISYKVLGKGPGFVIVHGAFRALQHYLRLAGLLSDTFTVYVMDRRGRNGSGEKGSEYSIEKECEDVIAILEKHNVSFLFGHSFGGLVSLNVALEYPLIKLAVYEPALFPYIPTKWLTAFEQEIKQGDFISASVTFLKGLQMGGIWGKMPGFLLKKLFGAMAKGPDWEENILLLCSVPEEVHAVLRMNSDIERYKQISALTLIMTGTKSPGYLKTIGHELESIIPEINSVSLKGLDHNAPDENAPEKIAEVLKDFLCQSMATY